jgi:cytochrome c peroxidase
MTIRRHVFIGAMWAAAVVGTNALAQSPFAWNLPAGFPVPLVPADNPMSAAKVELGRHLFYDRRLSGNGTQSCATCHEQARAFTDGRAQGVGSTGQVHPRGSMSLVNIAYAAALTWGNPALTRLEDQALTPMYGEHPVELGLSRSDEWLETLKGDDTYRELFAAAFPGGSSSFTRDNVVKAIASFERSIISGRSPYDRYHFHREDSAVSAAAKRGEVLFHSRPMSCFTCHGGFNFTGAVASERRPRLEVELHNTGLYNLAGLFSYPTENTGVFEVTRNPADVGKFKAPTLRNIAVTAPYMHDGSVATLEDAISHYAAGGRTIADGPLQGVGRNNPNKSPSVQGFTLTAEQRSDLLAFLRALTDEEVLGDKRFANPWRQN